MTSLRKKWLCLRREPALIVHLQEPRPTHHYSLLSGSFLRRLKSKRSAEVVLEELQELDVTLPVADKSYEDLPAPDAQGPSSRLWIIPRLTLKESCGYVQRVHRMQATTITQSFSNGEKQVEVTMQHKSVYRGLESEHWWVLTNDFYHLFPEDSQLPPMFFATVKAVTYIKCVGHQISVLTANLSTESSITSVTHSQFLQTKVSKTYRGVAIEDGCFRSSESSSTHILETPVVPQLPSRPLGPPPGFH
ncbi:uncharacterized protein [Hoplias malabaricus]|uniref:uncharacterized protein isoform X1 n=1 Tax=Hoplias malabaricus TaxID=27720 RepID=UPI0034629938